MTTWALTASALHEPWTFWTCHLVHHSWQHAADNILALSIPLVLVPRKDRGRMFLWLFLLAPVLGLMLLPVLHGGTFVGVSGLAAAAWALVGVHLLMSEEALPVGAAMLGLLGLKFTVEAMTGVGLLSHDGRWQAVSESHLYGTALGLGAAAVDGTLKRLERRTRCCVTRSLRKLVTVPR